jgi:uncharacterized iron-regulated membrane protein
VIDSFPFEEWTEDITGFWTFGPGFSTGTYIMTALGVIAMLAALVGFVVLEQRKLRAQAEFLRAAGGFPAPSAPVAVAAPSQEPLAGPSTDPGD